ncbi:MAG: DNA topoisomerase IV subunit A [Lactobacillales bacterium]|jgi:topoisomerase-4 subunit A|nr:DNA topoisomerase IV subunit A [Lactobacillales bacterium]
MPEIIEELTLEDVMGERFGRYSKYIIQERALPDVRDGLKPVQRRILFSMNKDGNTFEKAFRKSAKSVGNIMGNYHPHGDSSIYEAMVRMSQDWKLRGTLIEMHGNNGSMDGDGAAAMRYTEARLSKLASQLISDIEKDTVDHAWNFDDTEKEPTVLPTKFPNLLVNGSSGIAAGYATNIPTHNLGEVTEAAIYLLKHPNASLDKLMEFVKGPDFPTGGIIQGVENLKSAYETGKGKVVVRSKTSIEPLKGGKEQIVITEIPYEVNKAELVHEMEDVRINKDIEGIAEVRDETDRNGLQIVIELKKDANAQGILNYLLKKTKLQINYNFNMVAIDNMTPRLTGLKRMLEAFISHRIEVITRRSRFELNKAQKREHIVGGLIKALSILDQVIKEIRASKNKADAKDNLIAKFGFTPEQSEAIVSLQLYRLTNFDITALEDEENSLQEQINFLNLVLSDESELKKLMITELKEVSSKYATPRLTAIEEHIEELKVDTQVLIASEDVVVTITRDGYVKRSSSRSYGAVKPDENGLKEGDSVVFFGKLNTLHHIVLFTDKGNAIYRPVHELPDMKYKDIGEHLTLTITDIEDEKIVYAYSFESPEAIEASDQTLLFATRGGMIKQTALREFAPWGTYRKRSTNAMKLKSDEDRVIAIELVSDHDLMDAFVLTRRGFALRYRLDEIPVVGKTAAGVKSINLKDGDEVVYTTSVYTDGDNLVTLVTQRGNVKRMYAQLVNPLTRAKRGIRAIREIKKDPHQIIFAAQGVSQAIATTKKDNREIIELDSANIGDLSSNGSAFIDEKAEGGIVEVTPIISLELSTDEPE